MERRPISLPTGRRKLQIPTAVSAAQEDVGSWDLVELSYVLEAVTLAKNVRLCRVQFQQLAYEWLHTVENIDTPCYFVADIAHRQPLVSGVQHVAHSLCSECLLLQIGQAKTSAGKSRSLATTDYIACGTTNSGLWIVFKNVSICFNTVRNESLSIRNISKVYNVIRVLGNVSGLQYVTSWGCDRHYSEHDSLMCVAKLLGCIKCFKCKEEGSGRRRNHIVETHHTFNNILLPLDC